MRDTELVAALPGKGLSHYNTLFDHRLNVVILIMMDKDKICILFNLNKRVWGYDKIFIQNLMQMFKKNNIIYY